jgi:ribosome maturation factor RimP
MEVVEQIRSLVESNLTDTSQFVVDVAVKGHRGPTKVLIVIDGDNGVTIDDCANLSRELSRAFEDIQLFDDSYTLEVSTPGLDQPLRLQRQYTKNIGRKLKVVSTNGVVEGKLVAVMDDKIILEQELIQGKQKAITNKEIAFSDIEKTFVLVSFK